MTPEEIGARLSSLREAGNKLRRRPARDTLHALCAVLDGWRAPDSPWRAELARALPAATGFSAPMVRDALAAGLAPYSGAALLSLVERELSDAAADDGRGALAAGGFASVAVLLAGSIPLPTFPALVAPLALRSPVFAKTASRDPVTAPLLARSVAEVDAELGACIEVAAFPGDDDARVSALLDADCVVATGDDETVASVAARVRPPRRVVPCGHRMSAAALGERATRGEALAEAARGLARDVAYWDQLGCLSPVAVYAASRDAAAADRVAEALAEALAVAERVWPRGRVETGDAARIAAERSEAELRAAAGGKVALLAGHAWTVVREADASPRAAPLHRFVRVHPVADADALAEVLRPQGSHLAGVALAGFGPEEPALARALAALGASRVCRPGALQTPPLAWRRDNRGVLLPLARFCDLETGAD